MSIPLSRVIKCSLISKCNSPKPAIIFSPVSWLIVTFKVGSSFSKFLKTSINFGKSFGFFASIALDTTGSNKCDIASNPSIDESVVIVSPA